MVFCGIACHGADWVDSSVSISLGTSVVAFELDYIFVCVYLCARDGNVCLSLPLFPCVYMNTCPCYSLWFSREEKMNNVITNPFSRLPNLPGFYLLFRAWSHWRALEGGKHIQFILDNNLLSLSPSPFLNSIYGIYGDSRPLFREIKENDITGEPPQSPRDEKKDLGSTAAAAEEKLLLTQEKGQKLAQGLDLPELEIELERAIWQVEKKAESKDDNSSMVTKGR